MEKKMQPSINVTDQSKAVGIATQYCQAWVISPDIKNLGTLLSGDVHYTLTIKGCAPFSTAGKDALIEAFQAHFYDVSNHINVENLSFSPKAPCKTEGKHKVAVNLKIRKTNRGKLGNWSDQMTLTIRKVDNLFSITDIKSEVEWSAIEK